MEVTHKPFSYLASDQAEHQGPKQCRLFCFFHFQFLAINFCLVMVTSFYLCWCCTILEWKFQNNTPAFINHNKRPIGLSVLVVVLAMHDLKWAWHVQGQKYQHAFSIHPWDPNFHLFCFTMSGFWVTAQFLEKCTKWPNWPWHVQGQKYQHACYVHPPPPPRSQIFCPFRSTMSRSWVTRLFQKSAPNDT